MRTGSKDFTVALSGADRKSGLASVEQVGSKIPNSALCRSELWKAGLTSGRTVMPQIV
jgi:hypothetical protein